jgi:hypothetical protein
MGYFYWANVMHNSSLWHDINEKRLNEECHAPFLDVNCWWIALAWRMWRHCSGRKWVVCSCRTTRSFYGCKWVALAWRMWSPCSGRKWVVCSCRTTRSFYWCKWVALACRTSRPFYGRKWTFRTFRTSELYWY